MRPFSLPGPLPSTMPATRLSQPPHATLSRTLGTPGGQTDPAPNSWRGAVVMRRRGRSRVRGTKLPERQPRSTRVLPTEGPGAGAEQGSEASQGLLGARIPRAGPVLRAGPEAQPSWDRTVAVLCTRAAPCRPLEAPGEQRLSLYHENLSAWSTAHAQRGWWANECV